MLFFIFSDTVFACDLTAYSLADHADNRRQKTVGTNESAKADAAENAEKQQNHINLTKLSFSADSKQTFMHKKKISVGKLIVVSNFVMFIKKRMFTHVLYILFNSLV